MVYRDTWMGRCSCGQYRNFQYRCGKCGALGVNPRDY